jgi:hypothetical protein
MDLRFGCTWLVVPLLAAGACGGQTGGSEGSPVCSVAEPVAVALSEATPAGFSAEDMLAVAEGSHVFAARWPLLDSGSASATLTVTRSADAARYVESHSPAPRALPEHECADRVEIDARVELTLENARGSTRAAFDAVLTATTADRVDVQQNLAPEDFEDDVQFALGPDEFLGQILLGASFGSSTSGELIALANTPMHAEGPSGDYVYYGERQGALAVWPTSDACGAGNHPLALDSLALGVRPEDVLYAIRSELALRWDDGSETTAALMLTPAGAPCITDACAPWCPALAPAADAGSAPRSAIRIPVQVRIATADERWVGHFDAEVWFEVFHAGGLARVLLRHESQHASGQAIANDLGLGGIHAAGELTLVLLLECAPPADGALFIDSLSGTGELLVSDAQSVAASAQLSARPPPRPPTARKE